MDKRFGYFVFGGLLIGAALGSLWAVSGNTIAGTVIDALVGTAIGWFIAAAELENQNKKKERK